MILGNAEIKRRIAMDGIVERAVIDNIQPASLDCRLDVGFIFHGRKYWESEFVVYPGDFVLASTIENLNLPLDLSAYVEGKSSWGRIGLFVQNAGFVDPGFAGQITLELYNASDSPVKLVAGENICQLVFHVVLGCVSGYNGHYLGQSGVTKSRFVQ